MNRWKFIAMLFGGGALAKGQEAYQSIGGYLQQPRLDPVGPQEFSCGGNPCHAGHGGPEWNGGKAKPNQCPACGAMAKPWRVEHEKTLSSGWMGALAWGPGVKRERLEDAANLTRCSRCNAAFWQDAEK